MSYDIDFVPERFRDFFWLVCDTLISAKPLIGYNIKKKEKIKILLIHDESTL